MTIMLSIARNEARRIFVSPLAWTVLAVLQAILGIVFLLLLIEYAQDADSERRYTGVADYIGNGLYGFATLVLLIIVPLLTMRAFAEDRRSGSLQLLLAAPASLVDIVIGKFLGLTVFTFAAIALIAAMPLMLLVGTELDLGRITAGLLGLALLMMAFTAAGLFVSALTREPTIAAVGGFGLLLGFWLMQVLGSQSGPVGEMLGYLALTGHFENLKRGVFSSADVAYYLLFIGVFLWLTVLRLDSERG